MTKCFGIEIQMDFYNPKLATLDTPIHEFAHMEICWLTNPKAHKSIEIN